MDLKEGCELSCPKVYALRPCRGRGKGGLWDRVAVNFSPISGLWVPGLLQSSDSLDLLCPHRLHTAVPLPTSWGSGQSPSLWGPQAPRPAGGQAEGEKREGRGKGGKRKQEFLKMRKNGREAGAGQNELHRPGAKF